MALNATYLAELESRLETSDDRIEDLTRQIAGLETGSQKDEMATDGDSTEESKAPQKAALDQKEGDLRELQLKFDKAARECALLVEERDQLRASNETQQIARQQLEQRLESLSSVSQQSNIRQAISDSTPDESSAKVPGSPLPSKIDLPATESNETKQAEFYDSTQEHVKTLEELSIVKAQYQEALKKLSVLNARLERSGVLDLTFDEDGQDCLAPGSDGRVSLAEDESAEKGTEDQGQCNQSQKDGSPQTKGQPDFQVGRGRSNMSTAYV